ncbi:MAG: glycosyltransferase family 4 protein [Candidatus Zambryskibacteria bacterium]|nr:glycosyltransferase family 4 protein [Candidatus Zambryskibacteria bacterium]
MKVLIAAGIYPPDAGGPAIHAKAQFEGFPKFGIKTGLVTFAHYRKWPMGVRHFLYFLALLARVSGYDLVYAHDALGTGIPALMAAKIFGKKFMVRIGGDIAWESESLKSRLSMKEWYEKGEYLKSLRFKLSRWLMRHADIIATTSPIMNDLYATYYGISRDKIKLLPNPVSETPQYSVSKGNTIIFASRLTAYKNLSFVLKVLAEIFPNEPALKLMIMGDGPEKRNLEKLAYDLGIQNNVIFTGAVSLDEVLKRTAACLFVIAPALTEFNPNYVLQGVSFGKPFLISREHGLPFAVPDSLTFNPRNVHELKEKIVSLLEPAHYARMSQEARNIGFKMSWDDNLKMNKELIMSL